MSNQSESYFYPLDGLHRAFERYEDDGMRGVCGDWEVNKDISAFPGWWELAFAEEPVARCVPSEDYGRYGQFGNIERLNPLISDKNFTDICEIAQSVCRCYRIAPEEYQRIEANNQSRGR